MCECKAYTPLSAGGHQISVTYSVVTAVRAPLGWLYRDSARAQGGPVGIGSGLGGQAGRARLTALAALALRPGFRAMRAEVEALARLPVIVRD
jgi:hypothetical protein